MILKKYTGETIQDALRIARETLGEDTILLNSRPPGDDQPAVVTVMLDKKPAHSLPYGTHEKEEARFSNTFYKRSDGRRKLSRPLSAYAVAPSGEDEKAGAALEEAESENPKGESSETTTETTDTTAEKSAAGTEGKDPDSLLFRRRKKKYLQDQKDDSDHTDDDEAPADGLSMSRRSISLFQESGANGVAAGHSAASEVITREISALHRRFDQLEAMFNASVMSANLDYASHPSFQQLLKTGIRSTTIAQWFRQIMDQGIDPVDDSERFIYELTRLVRDALSFTLPSPSQSNIVFVGPAGSGKTTLIMKLARHSEFFGHKKVAIISVEPRQQAMRYSILKPFTEEHQIDLFQIKDGIDASKLMSKLSKYQQILIDTPSISLEKKTAFREYWKLRQILASVIPLEVHFVVNATMENYFFRESYAANHPLQPDYLALTHLDETTRWGQLIPFMKAMECGVRYLGVGPNVPDDINSYSPSWFAEKILSSEKREN